jgi:hypothetical protein
VAAGTGTSQRWSPGLKSWSSPARPAGRPGVGRSASWFSLVSSHAQPPSGRLQATAAACSKARRLVLVAVRWAAATIGAMEFIDRRASAALIVALACAGSLQAQSSNTSPQGPGLVVRNWHSATDWQAWKNSGHWRFVVSPFSHHFRYSEEHRYVWAIGMERQRPDDWVAGASFFSNSFGQPSSYTYLGKRFPALFGEPQLFAQATVGLMYGYRGKFQNKVPLNYKGFSPGALVSMGWQFTPRVAATAHMLGDAGVMLQLSYELH